MEHIGWSLVDKNRNEVAHWGDDKGVLPSIPNPLILPNGDQVCGITEVGPVGKEYSLVNRYIADAPPSPYHKLVARTVGYSAGLTVVTMEYEASPSIVPETVTPRQARLALLRAKKLASVKQAVNGLSEEDQITWEYATQVNRTDPLIISMGAALGLTELEIDNLFRLAVTL